MPCYTDFAGELNYTLKNANSMLCQACRHLTLEQLKAIKSTEVYSEHENLYKWYKNHLLHDFRHFYKDKEKKDELERVCSEAERLGLEIKSEIVYGTMQIVIQEKE